MGTIIGHRFCTLAVACVLALLACSKETIKITDPAIVDGVLAMDPKTNHEIEYTVKPEGTAVHWRSSDLNIVSVTQDILMALLPGTVKITGETESGSVTAFTVNVRPYNVTSFKIPETFSLYVDQKVEFPVTNIVPSQAGPSSLQWFAGEGGVLEWAFEGDKMFLIGVGGGKTELFAKTSGATVKEESCYVTVKEPTLKLSQENIGLIAGETAQLTLIQEPSGLYKNFEWSTSDATVATVVGNGTKATVTAGNKAGKAVITVKAGKYTLTLPVSVIDEDFQPYALTPEFTELHYDADKWPNKLIRQTVIPNGSTIWCLPSDVALYTSNSSAGYAYTESHRIYTVPCLEDGSEIPESLRKGITIKLSDPASIAGECYVWPRNADFWVTIFGYRDGRVTVDISTPKGKTYTCYYQMGVKNIAVSRLLYNNSEREFLGSTTPSGKITISKSDLSSSDKLSVDLSAMECQGYAPAYRGTVSSSNTSVAQVIDDEPFYGKKAIPTLKITGTGTTLITIQNAAKTFRTSFTLEVK